MRVSDFKDSNFNRGGGSVSFEERLPQPSDFNYSADFEFSDEYAKSPGTFQKNYPNWQAFADCFIMRRAVIHITGTQTCNTCSFRSNDIDDYTEADFTSVKDFKVPGFSTIDSIPSGKYMNVGMSFVDKGNGYSEVTINYVQYREWQLVQLISETPNPTDK